MEQYFKISYNALLCMFRGFYEVNARGNVCDLRRLLKVRTAHHNADVTSFTSIIILIRLDAYSLAVKRITVIL